VLDEARRVHGPLEDGRDESLRGVSTRLSKMLSNRAESVGGTHKILAFRAARQQLKALRRLLKPAHEVPDRVADLARH